MFRSSFLHSAALLFAVLVSSFAHAERKPAIVLIIDDLGNNRQHSMRAVALSGDVTYAILPHTPHAKTVANEAEKLGKEVIVHVPMSSIHGRNTGPGGLNEAQSKQNFVQVLNSNLGAVPYARGVNNHMGSALTQNDDMMSLMMSVLSEHELYFIDSRTSSKTVAANMAGLHNIKHLSRDIFLDNSPTIDDIHLQFQKLLRAARLRGVAVGIGHPYPATLDYLETVLPTLELTEQVRIIRGSEAIAQRYPQPQAELALKQIGNSKPLILLK